MKIGKKLNMLTYQEYLQLLSSYKKYTDFNHLGLFRSILENAKLSLVQQLEIRDIAIQVFPKFFEFLQVKDPSTFLRLEKLGKSLTIADEQNLRNKLEINQQKILASKRIKHRNFGIYSKHGCGYPTCHFNGIMTRQGSVLAEYNMVFQSESRHNYSVFSKALLNKQNRKINYRLIQKDLDSEGT
ncbi:MAG: hypothetical protein ACRYG7_21765 [Janthinobacterium lividum]